MPRVVIAAGGTAGHVVPALAVADELRARGAEPLFAGARGRAEEQLVPAAGLRDLVSGGARHRPPQPAARDGRDRAGGCGRRRARAACSAGVGADAVLGGGGYVAGPGRPRGRRAPHAAGADRGRQPPGPREPPAGAVRAPRVPRVPDPGPRRRPLRRHRAARSRVRSSRPTATPRASGSAFRPTRSACWCSAAASGARSLNLAAVEALRDSDAFVLHITGRARLRRGRRRALGDAPAGLPRARIPGHARRPARRVPTWWSRGPAARSSRSQPRAGPRSSSHIRTPPPTTRPATRAGWQTRAPPRCCATPS